MQKQSNRGSRNLAEEIVFNSASEERPPWSVCGRRCSRSASLFMIQSIVVFFLIHTSVVCIILSRSCEEKTVWVALLSSVVGFILPIPRYYFKNEQNYPNRRSCFHVHGWTTSIWKVPFNFPNVEEGNFCPCFWQYFLFLSMLPETVRWNAQRNTQHWIHWQSGLWLHWEPSEWWNKLFTHFRRLLWWNF